MRERVLKIVLVIVGLLFCGTAYPLVLFVGQVPPLAMMLSLYVTLGVFLLIAARDPYANRTLIAFTGWSSLVHASLMVTQVCRHFIASTELIGSGFFILIGITLLLLMPKRKTLTTVA